MEERNSHLNIIGKVSKIEVTKSITTKTYDDYSKQEIRETIEGDFKTEQQIKDATDSSKKRIDSQLNGWIKQKNELIYSFDQNKINWHNSQGQSGPFERSVDRDNPEFQKAVKMLMSPRSMILNGYYIWLFKDNITLGRKPIRKKQ